MNGYDLGRYVAAQIAGLVLLALIAGGVIALGGYLGIGWLLSHVHFA